MSGIVIHLNSVWPKGKKKKSASRYYFVLNIQRRITGKQNCSALKMRLKFGDWRLAIEQKKRKDLRDVMDRSVSLLNSYVENVNFTTSVTAFQEKVFKEVLKLK